MIKKYFLLIVLFFVLMMNTITLNKAFTAETITKNSNDILAEVNGKSIIRAEFEREFEFYIESMDDVSKKYNKKQEQKTQFLTDMAYSYAYEKMALKEGFDKTKGYEFAYKNIILEKLPNVIYDAISSNLTVSEKEIKEYYEKNKEQLSKQKLYHIYQIVSKDFNNSDSERAREKYDNYTDIKAIDHSNRKNLESVYKKYIETEKTANKLSNPKTVKKLANTSTDLGYCTLDFLFPEVASSVVTLDKGSVSEEIILTRAYPNIMRTPAHYIVADANPSEVVEKQDKQKKSPIIIASRKDGEKSDCYAMIRLIETAEPSNKNYELLKGQIQKILLKSKIQAAYEKYMNDLKKEFPFTMYMENINLLRKNYSFISYMDADKVIFKCEKSSYKLVDFMKYLQKLSIEQICDATLRNELELYYFKFCSLKMAKKYVRKYYAKCEKDYPDISSYARRKALYAIIRSKYQDNNNVEIPEAKIEERFAQVKEAFKQPNLNDLIKNIETTEKKDYDGMKKSIEAATNQYENSNRALVDKMYSSEWDDKTLKEQVKLRLTQEAEKRKLQDFLTKVKDEFKIKIYANKI